jgi:hypothetical protein
MGGEETGEDREGLTGGGRQEEEIIRRKGEDGRNYANRYSLHTRADMFRGGHNTQ